MKQIAILFLILLSLPLGGMEKRASGENEPDIQMLEAQELELAAKVQRVSSEQEMPKELSAEVQAQIKWLKKLAERGEFSNEVAANILRNFAIIEMPGRSNEEKLGNAIAAIRHFMWAFPQFYQDEPITTYLIEQLTKKYTPSNAIDFAIAIAIRLKTNAAGIWLQKKVGNNPNINKYICVQFLTAISNRQGPTAFFILNYFPSCINAKDLDGTTALIKAAKEGMADLVRRLLKVPGINTNIQDSQGYTALIYAAMYGRLEVVEELLRVKDLAVNTAESRGVTALMFAAQNGYTAIVDLLIRDPRININTASARRGATAFMLAAGHGKLAVIDLLLPKVNVNALSKEGSTALMYAAEKGQDSVIRKLLAVSGVNPNLKNKSGRTALMLAAQKGYSVAVEELLRFNGLNVNERDQMGNTALTLAVLDGKNEVVKRLLRVPGISITNQSGDTLLMHAARNGNVSLVKELLLIPEININAIDEWGSTALLLAARNAHTQVVKYLLEVPGIDLNAKDREGYTALKRARYEDADEARFRMVGIPKPNRQEIIKLLEARGAAE